MHCIEGLLPFSLSPENAETVKSMEKYKCYHLSFPYKGEHSKHRVEKKKILELGLKVATGSDLCWLQSAEIWSRCNLGNTSGKDLPPTNLIFFFISIWTGSNNAINVFQSLPSLIETSKFDTWSLVRQGSFAFWPLVHEQQTACSWNWAASRSLSYS